MTHAVVGLFFLYNRAECGNKKIKAVKYFLIFHD